MFSLICARINSWVNNGGAGDLRRNRGRYDVIVMSKIALVICRPHAKASFSWKFSNVSVATQKKQRMHGLKGWEYRVHSCAEVVNTIFSQQKFKQFRMNSILDQLGPLLITKINFNPSMEKLIYAQLSVKWNCLSIPNFNGCTVEVREWISNFHPKLYHGWNYLFMVEIKLIHVGKSPHCWLIFV